MWEAFYEDCMRWEDTQIHKSYGRTGHDELMHLADDDIEDPDGELGVEIGEFLGQQDVADLVHVPFNGRPACLQPLTEQQHNYWNLFINHILVFSMYHTLKWHE